MAKKSIVQKITSAFKPKLTPEELRANAERDYRMQMYTFKNYDTELEKTIQTFKNMAVDCKNKGQEGNALRAVQFIGQLKRTHEKVISVRQHLQMLHVMGGVSNIMVQFMETCASLGCNLSEQVDVSALGSGELSLAEGLNKIDFISDKIEQAFNTIQDHLNRLSDDSVEASEEDRKLLEQLMKDANPNGATEIVSTAAPAVSEPAQQAAAAQIKQVTAMTNRFENLGS